MWIWKNRDEIDVIEWDKYLQHSSSQQIELSSWYLDIVAQHWGAFYHKASGARIPVVYHTKWIFINQVYRPSFIQQMNIISQNTLEVRILFCHYFHIINREFNYFQRIIERRS